MRMGKRLLKQISTASLSDCGHAELGPSGPADQSWSRTRVAMSPTATGPVGSDEVLGGEGFSGQFPKKKKNGAKTTESYRGGMVWTRFVLFGGE